MFVYIKKLKLFEYFVIKYKYKFVTCRNRKGINSVSKNRNEIRGDPSEYN